MRFIAIILCFATIISCKNDPNEQFLPYHIDVNDGENTTIESATTFNESSNTVVGFLRGDDKVIRRYYRLSSEVSVSYKIELTAVPGVDSSISIADSSGERLLTMNERAVGEAEVIWNYFSGHKKLYVVVESKSGNNANVPFMLTVKSVDEHKNAEVEPNDSEALANALSPRGTLKAHIVPTNDVDFYQLSFPKGEVLDFRVKLEAFSNLDVSMTIIDKRMDRKFLINDAGYGGAEVSQYFSSDNGEYYVRVNATVADITKEPLYYITVEVLPEGINYEREFNDDLSNATVVLSQEEFSGIIEQGDIDNFVFDILSSSSRVDISIEGIANRDFSVEILDSDYTAVISEVGNTNISIRALPKGRYYLMLKRKSERAGRDAYKLFLNIYK